MLADGAITAAAPLVGRPGPAGKPRPAARARGLPGARLVPAGPDTAVAERLADFEMHRIDLAAGAVLEKGCVYVVPLVEGLALPASDLGGRQRQELDRPARPLHPADHRPRHRVRPHRRRLRRPALRRDLAALVLGAGAPRHAAQPDPLPPRQRGARRPRRCARLRRGASGWSTAPAHIAGGLAFSVDLTPRRAASSAIAPSRIPG